ncbi:hypothetical protein [Brevundimonas sp.]|uniref:hypothetical protein n=1 Tax=Brevundimonas sp. TaxID=1871086 RepID=UPI00356376EA
MTARRTLGLGVFAAAMWVGGAFACSPPPGDAKAFFEREERAYLEEVTSIYQGVMTDVVGRQDEPLTTFTVRKTAEVWGAPGPRHWPLRFETGSCAKYFPFLIDWEQGQGPRNGMPVTIFVTPAAKANPELLYIQPSGPDAEAMIGRWRDLRINETE